MKSNLPPAHQLYLKKIQDKRMRGSLEETYAMELWQDIPATLGQAAEHLTKKRIEYSSELEQLEILKKKIKQNLKRIGILTDSTEENIDRMHLGVVETGQQPNCLGGPSLVLNKANFAKKLSELARICPLFNVVDYDGIKPELTKTRLPGLSPRGVQISYPTTSEKYNCPIYTLDNPSEKWLQTTLEKIRKSYSAIMKGIENKEKYLHNLEHIFTIIKSSYYSTRNVSDFSTKIMGTLINIESCKGIPIYCYSMSDTNQLFQTGYETLLSEPNRSRFIETSNQAAEKIIEAGFIPQIGQRTKDYVPFYIECAKCRNRIELKYERRNESSNAIIQGKCPKCGETHVSSYNASSPDLTEIIDRISPRVDSRQLIVNSVVPVLARVGGPAETAYFAELIPAAKVLGMNFPFILRYSRVFYNTPWNERLGKSIEDKGYPSLMNKLLFNALKQWIKSRNVKDEKGLESAHKRIQYSISTSYRDLNKTCENLKVDIASRKAMLKDANQRSELVNEIQETQKTLQEVELYLSWAYGRYNPDKFGQEVNWNWIDLALVTGVKDVLGVYERLYSENTPNSSVFFINL